MNIHTLRYIDVLYDFPDDARDAYQLFVGECGLSNGEFWSWDVGDNEDSVPYSYIGKEKCDIIDNALREAGLKDGETIALMFEC